MIDIKDISGKILFSVQENDETVFVEELMSSDYIRLSWHSDKGDSILVSSYIEYDGEKYRLLETYTPQMENEAEYVYSPKFDSRVIAWGKQIVPVYTYGTDGTTVKTREMDWEFTGSPADAMFMVKQAIKNETGEEWTVQLSDSLPATISISSQSASILSVLNSIADECETEWWTDKKSNTLYLSKCVKGDPITLEVGEQVDVPSVTDNSEGYYTRFYAFGSTRNIVQESLEGGASVNKRLTLDPVKYPYGYKDIRSGLSQEEVFVKVLYYDKIYPSSKLTISDVRARLRYRVDNEGNRIKIGGTDEEPVYEQYAIWYFRIGGFTFDPDTIIEGKNLSASFESGQLSGRDFELEYHEKSETVKDGNDVTPFEVKAGDYEIIIDESTGSIIPGLSYIIPQDGDSVILYNIVMPNEYTKSAQDELEAELDKYIAKQEEDSRTYQTSSNPVYFYKNNTDLSLGQSVTFMYGGISVSTRIQSVEKRLDFPCYQNIKLGNKVVKGIIQQLKDDVVYTNKQIDIIKAFNELSVSLTNAYANAQREMMEGFAAIKKLWSLGEDSEGNQYAYTNFPIVGVAGMTLFAGDEIKVDSIFKGLPIDAETLQWVDGVLTVVGGGTGGGASNWDELEGKPSWITDTKPTYAWGEITQKPTTLSGYGIQASDVLNTLKNVDGSGSGLDADLLDGVHLVSNGYGTGVKRTFFFDISINKSYIKLGTLKTVAGTGDSTSKVMFTVRGGINYGGTNESVYEVSASTRGSIQVTSTLVRGNRELKFGYVSTSSNVEIWMAYDYNYRGTTEVEVSASSNFTLSMTETNTKPSGFVEGSYRILAATTDNVASATKLQTARTIWGQSFDGTANVSGSLTSVTNITGTGTFTGANIKATDSVYVNGIRLHKTADGVITLEGNLAVTGGITQFAVNEVNPSTIMDGVVVDGTSIKKENGVLKVMNAGGGEAGSVKWANITDKPVTLAGYGVSASNVLSTLKTVDGGGSGLDADLLDGVHLVSNGYGTGVKRTFFFDISINKSYIKLGTLKTVAGTGDSTSKVMFTVRGGINYGGTNESVYEVSASTRGSIQVTSTLVRGNRELKFGYVSTSSNVEIWMAYDYNYRGTTEVEVSASSNFTLSMTETNTKPSGFVEGSYRILAATTDNVTSATNADKLDGVHLNGVFTAFIASGNNTRLTIGGVTKDLTVPYANNADMLDGVQLANIVYYTDTNSYDNTICSRIIPISDVNLTDGAKWGSIFQWTNTTTRTPAQTGVMDNWFNQLFGATNNRIYFRTRTNGGGWTPWNKLAYITDNVASATKLQTARNLWGQSFDGTKDVTGDISHIRNIFFDGYARSYNNMGGFIFYPAFNDGEACRFECVNGEGTWVNRGWALLQNGNFGIGSISPSEKLHVIGNILATGGGTFYSSDIRAKTIIERPKISLNSIANAPVIKFRWNGYNGLKDDNKLHVGGIAQYVEKILPECVIGQKDDFLSFDYATTGYVFSVLTARHLLSYETRTDWIIRKLKERIKRLEKQLNIENHEEVSIVAD